jgi:septum formation protein
VRFVLASASPARLSVLRAAGIKPSVVVSGVDEDAVAASVAGRSPGDVVTTLAMAKAEAVVPTVAERDAVVVGCDSMLSIGGELVGKPGEPEVARKRWAQMAGSTGELLTGHAVVRIESGRRTRHAVGSQATTVRFADPDPAELDAYLATGEPLNVAGAFTLDGLGGWFVEGIEGDPSSVIGISLPLTRRLLAQVGVSVVDLWNP